MTSTYFIQEAISGRVKIGKADSPEQRLRELQTGNPERLFVIGLLSGNRERELHEMFAAERLHGEWFQSSERLLWWIKTNSQCPPDYAVLKGAILVALQEYRRFSAVISEAALLLIARNGTAGDQDCGRRWWEAMAVLQKTLDDTDLATAYLKVC